MPDPVHSLITTASVSITGRRKQNQDAVAVETLADGRLLVALADGMGGHAAGEVASQMSLDTIRAAVAEGTALADALMAADHAVREAASEPGLEGMGTTAVAAIMASGDYVLANVGDSRAYWIDAEGAAQLTDDHSFVAERVRAGDLTPEQALRSPVRNLLTRAIGGQEALVVDAFGPFPLETPGALLLCSDGLHGSLTPGQIHAAVVESASAQAAAEALTARAHELGSSDNISVVLAGIGGFLGSE